MSSAPMSSEPEISLPSQVETIDQHSDGYTEPTSPALQPTCSNSDPTDKNTGMDNASREITISDDINLHIAQRK